MMTIAEKLLKIAQGQQEIYEAGYEKGTEEGGGSDGGSMETCSLIIEDKNARITRLIYQNILSEAICINADPMTLVGGTYDVVCGTLLYIEMSSNPTITYENLYCLSAVISGQQSSSDYCYLITAKAGEVAKLIINLN